MLPDKTLTAGVLVLVAFLFWGTLVNAQNKTALTGDVTDIVGALIPRAIVIVASAGRVWQSTTNEEGQFTFADLPPGSYQLEASVSGFKTKAINLQWPGQPLANPLTIQLDVATPGCDSPISATYKPAGAGVGGKLQVSVIRANLPLASTVVSVVGEGAPAMSHATDAAGRIYLDNLKPGQYSLKIKHHGYRALKSNHFWITDANETIVIVTMYKKDQLVVCQ